MQFNRNYRSPEVSSQTQHSIVAVYHHPQSLPPLFTLLLHIPVRKHHVLLHNINRGLSRVVQCRPISIMMWNGDAVNKLIYLLIGNRRAMWQNENNNTHEPMIQLTTQHRCLRSLVSGGHSEVHLGLQVPGYLIPVQQLCDVRDG
jgi:hypothetical protein